MEISQGVVENMWLVTVQTTDWPMKLPSGLPLWAPNTPQLTSLLLFSLVPSMLRLLALYLLALRH